MQFEFGKNYLPEMSYEHRGLVIGISGALLYVLPICSYSDRYKGAYHPVENPDEHSGYYMMRASEFPFLPHDSVLKLNDIRTVSTARIKYRQPGARIPPESETYKNIESIVHAKYFFDYSYELGKLRAENELLKQENARLSDELERLQKKVGEE